MGQAASQLLRAFKRDLEKAKIEMRDIKREEKPPTRSARMRQVMVIKWGRNGHFLACSGTGVSNTKEYTARRWQTGESCPAAPTDQLFRPADLRW